MQLSDAMNDLQEQVKVEHAPTDKNEHNVEVSFPAAPLLRYKSEGTCPEFKLLLFGGGELDQHGF